MAFGRSKKDLEARRASRSFFGTCSRNQHVHVSRVKTFKGEAAKKNGPNEFRLGEAGLIIPVPDSCYLGRFFTKRADFLHVHHSDIPITEYNHLEPFGKRKHVKTAVFHLFGAFFGLPDADIHSPHLPMVIYHVFGVTTFFGTIRQFHSEWPRALELPPKTLAEPQRG